MNLFSQFFTSSASKIKADDKPIFEVFKNTFSNVKENELIHIAALTCLMIRVAFADMKVDESEKEFIKKNLIRFFDLPEITAQNMLELAHEKMNDYLGIENQIIAAYFKEHYSRDQRFKLLEFLFTLSAADGEVEQVESEELRLICKGLDLENDHFLAARANVAKHLTALK